MWLFFSAFDDLKGLYSVRCLDCNAEVSAEVKSAHGRDETVFFLFSINRT